MQAREFLDAHPGDGAKPENCCFDYLLVVLALSVDVFAVEILHDSRVTQEGQKLKWNDDRFSVCPL